jgi:hypothetical protein
MNIKKYSVGRPEELSTDVRIILKYISWKPDGRVWKNFPTL